MKDNFKVVRIHNTDYIVLKDSNKTYYIKVDDVIVTPIKVKDE